MDSEEPSEEKLSSISPTSRMVVALTTAKSELDDSILLENHFDKNTVVEFTNADPKKACLLGKPESEQVEVRSQKPSKKTYFLEFFLTVFVVTLACLFLYFKLKAGWIVLRNKGSSHLEFQTLHGMNDGGYTMWTDWSDCVEDSVHICGRSYRNRSCSDPPPSNGGLSCTQQDLRMERESRMCPCYEVYGMDEGCLGGYVHAGLLPTSDACALRCEGVSTMFETQLYSEEGGERYCWCNTAASRDGECKKMTKQFPGRSIYRFINIGDVNQNDNEEIDP